MKHGAKVTLICQTPKIGVGCLLGICYEGGLDADARPADTRTPAQKAAMRELLKSLCTDYPEAEILGHRDLPGVHKECPSFNVKKWLTSIHFHI